MNHLLSSELINYTKNILRVPMPRTVPPPPASYLGVVVLDGVLRLAGLRVERHAGDLPRAVRHQQDGGLELRHQLVCGRQREGEGLQRKNCTALLCKSTDQAAISYDYS